MTVGSLDPPATARDLAMEMLRGETGSVSDISGAQCRIFDQIRRELGHWIGADACAALAGRALADARERHACLEAASFAADGEGLGFRFDGTAAHAPEEVLAAFEDVLTSFIELLGRFVGPDLAIRFVLQGWRARSAPGDLSR